MKVVFRKSDAGAVVIAAALVCASGTAHASDKSWDDASTVARDLLVVATLGAPVVQQDWNGALQAAGSIGVTAAATWGLKEAFPERRPDGSDRKSFPSGHTSVAFASAATLENRYGWKAGLPAHIAAIFVGVARVKAEKHHWYDAVAGAALGEATGLLITSKHDSKVQLFPWSEGKAAGVAFNMRF